MSKCHFSVNFRVLIDSSHTPSTLHQATGWLKESLVGDPVTLSNPLSSNRFLPQSVLSAANLRPIAIVCNDFPCRIAYFATDFFCIQQFRQVMSTGTPQGTTLWYYYDIPCHWSPLLGKPWFTQYLRLAMVELLQPVLAKTSSTTHIQ